MFRKASLAVGVLALALPMAGCGTPQGYNAGNGALLGAGTGALVGGLATGRAGGALAGGAIGAATGALVGAAATPAPPPGYYYPPPPPPPRYPRCYRRGYDYNGNPICLEYYG